MKPSDPQMHTKQGSFDPEIAMATEGSSSGYRKMEGAYSTYCVVEFSSAVWERNGLRNRILKP